eukprot:scaffold64767_cov56-Phaeocystis_antarctica.AAC.3
MALPLSSSQSTVMPSRPQSAVSSKLPARDGDCQRALTPKQTLRGGGALQRPDSAVLRQVKREQLRVRSIERVMICGITETVDKMTSTLSPSELLSRL